MVCKNCGADLKPGIKYCLECGSYIDEEEEIEEEEENGELSSDYKPIEFRDEATLQKKKRKRRKLNLTTTDYLIYAGLLIVLIGSIIVIIVAVVNSNKANSVEEPSTLVSQTEKTLTIDNYTVKVPAGVNPTVDGSTLSVSDNRNYSFSYTLQKESFDTYLEDNSIIEKELKSANHQVNGVSEKEISNRKFLIYDITVNGEREYFYLTKVNGRYTAVGVISILTNGNWELALNTIDEITNSVTFQS